MLSNNRVRNTVLLQLFHINVPSSNKVSRWRSTRDFQNALMLPHFKSLHKQLGNELNKFCWKKLLLLRKKKVGCYFIISPLGLGERVWFPIWNPLCLHCDVEMAKWVWNIVIKYIRSCLSHQKCFFMQWLPHWPLVYSLTLSLSPPSLPPPSLLVTCQVW